MPTNIWSLLLQAFAETVYMVFAAGIISFVIGIPIGILLCISDKNHIAPSTVVNQCLATVVNIGRSIPFIILMVAIIPVTRWITGTSIGTTAALVPLAISAIPFVAKIAENAFKQVAHGLLEAGKSMGASNWQLIFYILLPESRVALIHGLTLTLVTLVSFSAMAGAIGGGGLGDLAIRYGYQRFNSLIMIITVVILVGLVQAIQLLGNKLSSIYNLGKN